MTRRTDPANLAACAAVLGDIVNQVNANAMAVLVVRQRPELAHVFEAATAALAGVALERVACSASRPKPCGWVGLFPVHNPDGFRCARCRSTAGEALP